MATKVAIILAAGAGERMGGSKALLLVDGKTLAAAHVARAIEAGCDRAVVVTRPEVAARLGEIPRASVLAATTGEQAESLQVAVRKVGMRGDVRVLVTPVDCPPVSVATMHALFAALDAGSLVATPLRDGRGGHPVVCVGSVLAPYASKDPAPPPPLRDVLAAHDAKRARVAVDDASSFVDLDTPEDVLAFTGKPPAFA